MLSEHTHTHTHKRVKTKNREELYIKGSIYLSTYSCGRLLESIKQRIGEHHSTKNLGASPAQEG